MESDTRKESSIPLSARVPIVDLAEMVEFWENQGVSIKSMSQLVAWSISAFVEVLKANGKLDKRDIAVGDAHRVLTTRGLYQPKALERGAKKIVAAIGMDNMRMEGQDPKSYYGRTYSSTHSSQSVEPLPKTKIVMVSREQEAAIEEAIQQHGFIEQTEEDIVREKLERLREDAKAIAAAKLAASENESISEDNLDCKPIVDNKPLVKEKMTKDEFATAGDEILRRDKEMEERMKFARPKNVVPD